MTVEKGLKHEAQWFKDWDPKQGQPKVKWGLKMNVMWGLSFC